VCHHVAHHMRVSSCSTIVEGTTKYFPCYCCCSALCMCMHVRVCYIMFRVGQNRIWPYIWWFPCQKYRIYTVYIWFWPTLIMLDILMAERARRTNQESHAAHTWAQNTLLCVPRKHVLGEITMEFPHLTVPDWLTFVTIPADITTFRDIIWQLWREAFPFLLQVPASIHVSILCLYCIYTVSMCLYCIYNVSILCRTMLYTLPLCILLLHLYRPKSQRLACYIHMFEYRGL